MGYSSFPADQGYSVCAIARRQKTEGGQKSRYETVLPPGSKVSYLLHADIFRGEWQLAAQGTDKRLWPWGNEFHGTNCNNGFNRSTPVDAFSKGQSPYGVMDMVGNVWQMTNDTYFNGAYYFVVIRGGSYYRPDSSWWYLQGGPQQLDKTQIMLMISPGFDRNATVGFRCVKDINRKNFKGRR